MDVEHEKYLKICWNEIPRLNRPRRATTGAADGEFQRRVLHRLFFALRRRFVPRGLILATQMDRGRRA